MFGEVGAEICGYRMVRNEWVGVWPTASVPLHKSNPLGRGGITTQRLAPINTYMFISTVALTRHCSLPALSNRSHYAWITKSRELIGVLQV